MTFKTKPRYIGEFAKHEYEIFETLNREFPPLKAEREQVQQKILNIVRTYNTGLITQTEAIKEIIRVIQ